MTFLDTPVTEQLAQFERDMADMMATEWYPESPDLSDGDPTPPADDSDDDGGGGGGRHLTVQFLLDFKSRPVSVNFYKVTSYTFMGIGDDRVDGIWPEHYQVDHELEGVETSTMIMADAVCAIAEQWS
jgi:hypothetical protein